MFDPIMIPLGLLCLFFLIPMAWTVTRYFRDTSVGEDSLELRQSWLCITVGVVMTTYCGNVLSNLPSCTSMWLTAPIAALIALGVCVGVAGLVKFFLAADSD